MDAALKQQEGQAGAQFTERSGRETPSVFSAVETECAAVHQSVGLLDLSWQRIVRFTGKDRATWLHGLTTNHVNDLQPGQAQRNTICNNTGHLVAVFRLINDGDSFWADFPPGCADAALELLDRHLIMEEVEIADLRDAWGILSLQGPRFLEALRAVDSAVAAPGPDQAIHWSFQSEPVLLIGSRHTGERGVDLLAPQDLLAPLWTALLAGVHGAGGGPVALDALQVLRVEAGIPWWGDDLDSSVLMLEAGMEDAIHYQKGCYLGQETLARVHFRGHTNRQLAGLELSGSALPEPGAALLSQDRDAGRITSVVHSPALQKDIALGFVRRELLEPGTVLSTPEGVSATVRTLPFVTPQSQG